MSSEETIAAIATPPGTGGIGIVRISGSEARKIGEVISGGKLIRGRTLFRQFYDSEGSALDHGLCLFFRAPHSFTGEDTVELQGHGGPILLDMLLQRVCELGARLARAGEFSERAFLNGKIDLTQAEAIADLITSGSRAATRAAMRSLQGHFSNQIHTLADEVIALRAYIEAALDFAEEEIDFLQNSDIRTRLGVCVRNLQSIITSAEQGLTLREGLNVALAGLPNAGKSSLLNFLAGYEAAIVTDIEGTTRDVLKEYLSLRGLPIRINDLAGLREATNKIEQEGVRRAWEEIAKADVVIYLVDCNQGVTDDDREFIERLNGQTVQRVFSKSDLCDPTGPQDADAVYISTVTGQGIELLIDRIVGKSTDFDHDNQVTLARRRHVEALRQAADCVDRAAETFATTLSGELVAEDLRHAQNSLNEITGEFSSDDLLGKIFSSFCIGK